MSDRIPTSPVSPPSIIPETLYISKPGNYHTSPEHTAQTSVSDISAANESASDQSNPPLNDTQSNDQAAPAPRQANPKPETLTLTLPSVEDDEKDHHAVVSFPATYKDATEIAVEVLGCYMTDARPENVVLRCSTKNRKGEWIWADILPRNWTLVLQHNGAEVGVFERQRRNILDSDACFIHGKVYFTLGTQGDNDSVTEWTEINQIKSRSSRPGPLIDRPKTYADAVRIAKMQLTRMYHRYDAQTYRTQLEDKTFTFYTFPQNNSDLSSWVAIPPKASTDDDFWRALVPSTYGVLGVILT